MADMVFPDMDFHPGLPVAASSASRRGSALVVLVESKLFYELSPDWGLVRAIHRGPKDHTNIRIVQTMISGIPLMLGLGTRMSDPDETVNSNG